MKVFNMLTFCHSSLFCHALIFLVNLNTDFYAPPFRNKKFIFIQLCVDKHFECVPLHM